MKDPQELRWRPRPIVGAMLSIAVFVVPLAFAILAAAVAVKLLPQPDTRAALLVWWLLVISSTLAALYVFDRLARRLLPLAALMKLTMVFPDNAPSRMALARRAVRTRDLNHPSTLPDEAEVGMAQQTAEQILTLLSALTNHDRATRGHSEKVRVLVDMISEELKLTEHERDRLRWAALLHDVGKLSVPKELLNKKGNPSEVEWDLIRTHPTEGARIVAPLHSFLGEWVGAIEHHHEKWDGTGYPLGLFRQEISLGGRIVAVADAYDVITGSRPYKKPLGVKAAREELAKQAGTHFDPHIVRALFNISLGRLWRAVGFSSWVATLPFLPPWLLPRLSDALRNLGTATAGAATAIALGGGLIATPSLVTNPIPQRDSPALAQADPSSPQPTEVLGVRFERQEVPVEPPAARVVDTPPSTGATPPPSRPSQPPAPAPDPAPTLAPPTPPSVEETTKVPHGQCVSDVARDVSGPKGPQVNPIAKSDSCR